MSVSYFISYVIDNVFKGYKLCIEHGCNEEALAEAVESVMFTEDANEITSAVLDSVRKTLVMQKQHVNTPLTPTQRKTHKATSQQVTPVKYTRKTKADIPGYTPSANSFEDTFGVDPIQGAVCGNRFGQCTGFTFID